MEGKGSGKNTSGRVLDPAWNEVCKNNPWCNIPEESTHTALSEAPRGLKLACRYKEQAEESLARCVSSRAAS